MAQKSIKEAVILQTFGVQARLKGSGCGLDIFGLGNIVVTDNISLSTVESVLRFFNVCDYCSSLIDMLSQDRFVFCDFWLVRFVSGRAYALEACGKTGFPGIHESLACR